MQRAVRACAGVRGGVCWRVAPQLVRAGRLACGAAANDEHGGAGLQIVQRPRLVGRGGHRVVARGVQSARRDGARVRAEHVKLLAVGVPAPGRLVGRARQDDRLGRVQAHLVDLLGVTFQCRLGGARGAVVQRDVSVGAASRGQGLTRVHTDTGVPFRVRLSRAEGGEAGDRLRSRLVGGRLPLLAPLRQPLCVCLEAADDRGRHARRAVHLHGGRRRRRRRRRRGDGRWARLSERLASVVSLLDQPRDDAARSIMLVEGLPQLLPRRIQLLLERERLEHQSVPLVLKEREHPGDAARTHGAGLHRRAHLQGKEVVLGQRLAGDRALPRALDVLLDNRLLEEVARLAHHRVLRRVARDGTEHCSCVASGSWPTCGNRAAAA